MYDSAASAGVVLSVEQFEEGDLPRNLTPVT